jgi:hypothetical protein
VRERSITARNFEKLAKERFGKGISRSRRIWIVALAQGLLIDLWRYVECGVLPTGARLKASSSVGRMKDRTGNGIRTEGLVERPATLACCCRML